VQDVIVFGENVETGEEVGINLEYLIDQKLQILGNSRSGKSRLARVIAEAANGKIQQIIISPKKEFVTLREKFDYIHVGRKSELSKPDIELNTKYAEQLALDVMKVGMDVIIEFSEAPKERIKFVRNFIEGLMMVPQKDWHPTAVIIDEIDIWAPERGHGEAESLGAIIDLAARGADKGYSLIAITQKLAKFNKDVASELNIKLIGNVSLDTDQNRACQELGIEKRNKQVLATLGKPNYHFFAYGPGLSDEVIKIKSYNPITSHVPGWKLNKQTKPIPTPKKVKELLSAFSGLEQEAEIEIKTKGDMIEKINKLEGQLRVALSKQPTPGSPGDAKHIEKLTNDLALLRQAVKNDEQYIEKLEKTIDNTTQIIINMLPDVEHVVAEATDKIKEMLRDIQHKHLDFKPRDKPTKLSNTLVVKTVEYGTGPVIIVNEPVTLEVGDLTTGPKKILQAIRMFYPKSCSFVQAGAIAVFTPSGGTFGNYVRELKRKGYVTVSGKTFTLTDLGLQATEGSPVLPMDTESLLNLWSTKIGAGQMKILKEIIANGQGITLDELGMATDFTPGGGTFGNYIRELKRLELIIVEDKIAKPNKEFFGML